MLGGPGFEDEVEHGVAFVESPDPLAFVREIGRIGVIIGFQRGFELEFHRLVALIEGCGSEIIGCRGAFCELRAVDPVEHLEKFVGAPGTCRRGEGIALVYVEIGDSFVDIRVYRVNLLLVLLIFGGENRTGAQAKHHREH